MISCTVTGNVGGQAETKYLADGTPIINFSIASNSREKVDGAWKEVPTWVRVSAFGKRYEAVAKFLEKGKTVAVRGALAVREYDGKNGKAFSVDMRADDVELLGGGGGKGAGGGSAGGGQFDGQEDPF